jgi:hypothetical protein
MGILCGNLWTWSSRHESGTCTRSSLDSAVHPMSLSDGIDRERRVADLRIAIDFAEMPLAELRDRRRSIIELQTRADYIYARSAVAVLTITSAFLIFVGDLANLSKAMNLGVAVGTRLLLAILVGMLVAGGANILGRKRRTREVGGIDGLIAGAVTITGSLCATSTNAGAELVELLAGPTPPNTLSGSGTTNQLVAMVCMTLLAAEWIAMAFNWPIPWP